ncbi:hypothetical protein IFR05_012812 [Cadophora sp. M221]|nr:hypothetical protein IFR05_012812 [Cadophora sp. M221]
MPAPHDKRFVKIFQRAQEDPRWSDAQLLTFFEECLTQAIHDDPAVPEDRLITKAMRGWFRRLFSGANMPKILSYNRQLEHRPRFGDAFVVQSRAPGTFCRIGDFVFTDPSSDPQPMSRGSRVEDSQYSYGHTTPARARSNRDEGTTVSAQRQTRSRLGSGLAGSRGEGNVRDRMESLPNYRGSSIAEGARRFSPLSSNRRTSNNFSTPNSSRQRPRPNTNTNSSNYQQNNDDTMASMAPPASPANEEEGGPVSRVVTNPNPSAAAAGYTDGDGSRVIVESQNEYLALEAFITLKALKDGWTKQELDNGWKVCEDKCWTDFGDKGFAYVQYRTEMRYWCNLFRGEIFPGRDPLTRQYTMLTQREMAQKEEFREEHLAAGMSRTPSLSGPSEPANKRVKKETNGDN